MQDIVDEREIELLITQINVKEKNKIRKGTLVLQESEEPTIVGQIHDEVSKKGIISGTHGEPFYLDLENARVGIITGNDYMLPETITSLAKMGTDIVLISSYVIDNEKSKSNYSYVSNDYMEFYRNLD